MDDSQETNYITYKEDRIQKAIDLLDTISISGSEQICAMNMVFNILSSPDNKVRRIT